MTDLVTIFCEIDDFCKDYFEICKKSILSNGKNIRKKAFSLTSSEIITIAVWYHQSGYITFKDYYIKYVIHSLKNEFKKIPSYNRFIELRLAVTDILSLYLCTKKISTCTGISYIDSFKLEACHIKRSSGHKQLKFIAAKGKTSVGWFYGIKVHIVINEKGEIISLCMTPGNTADNAKKVLTSLTKNVKGKLFGDKGYIINKQLFKQLYLQGTHIITKLRSNMKNILIDTNDKMLLKKRGIIESVGNILKNTLSLEHSRHRSITGFFNHIFTTLIAYQYRDKKPSFTFTNQCIDITA